MGFGPACCLRVACQQDLIFKIHLQTHSRLPDLFTNISVCLGAQQMLSPSVGAPKITSWGFGPWTGSSHVLFEAIKRDGRQEVMGGFK